MAITCRHLHYCRQEGCDSCSHNEGLFGDVPDNRTALAAKLVCKGDHPIGRTLEEMQARLMDIFKEREQLNVKVKDEIYEGLAQIKAHVNGLLNVVDDLHDLIQRQ